MTQNPRERKFFVQPKTRWPSESTLSKSLPPRSCFGFVFPTTEISLISGKICSLCLRNIFSFVHEKLIKIFSLFYNRRDLCQENPTALSSPPNDLARIFCHNISGSYRGTQISRVERSGKTPTSLETVEPYNLKCHSTLATSTTDLSHYRRESLATRSKIILKFDNKKDCFFKSSNFF